MKAIQNYELITAAVDHWVPSDIAFIKSIHIFPQDDDFGKTDILMHVFSQARQRNNKGWPDCRSAFREIGLIFRGITELQLKCGGQFPIQVTGFDIEYITERRWEGINFIIYDYENGTISFNCREIAVTSVGEPRFIF